MGRIGVGCVVVGRIVVLNRRLMILLRVEMIGVGLILSGDVRMRLRKFPADLGLIAMGVVPWAASPCQTSPCAESSCWASACATSTWSACPPSVCVAGTASLGVVDVPDVVVLVADLSVCDRSVWSL
jgi:hypothetical protein